MFNQSPLVGPGSSSLTAHSVEILIMLVGAFLLGFLLARALAAKSRVPIEDSGQGLATRKEEKSNPLIAPAVAEPVALPEAAPETPAPAMAAPPEIVAADIVVAPAAVNIVEADDLKRIDGIGPKIEQILSAAGITNFAALAVTTEATLRDVLTAHNPRLRTQDTSTWPTQAALARDGEWEKLKDMQKKGTKKKR